MKVAIIKYNAGNIRSVENALKRLGVEACITADEKVLNSADKIIFPGVGEAANTMEYLHHSGLDNLIRSFKQPVLGICLGMQSFFETSEENGIHQGFGFLKGHIRFMEDPNVRIPHIGWNALEKNQDHPIWKNCSSQVYVYYVHSYYAKDMDPQDLVGVSEYGKMKIPGLVIKDNWMGCQFHPEKSGKDGLEILRYFLEDF